MSLLSSLVICRLIILDTAVAEQRTGKSERGTAVCPTIKPFAVKQVSLTLPHAPFAIDNKKMAVFL
ncbi:MAG: hypothetical protein KA362_01340 [Chloroflexi bacterium]|nr:hypothetical protein [Chloroflexota bacterium]